MKITSRAAILLGCGLCALASPSSSHALPRLAQAPARHAEAPAEAEAPEGAVLARGKIKAITRPPKPGSVPYKDAVISIHLVDVEAPGGKITEKEILVFAWGMRDNTWTSAAGFREGQTIKLPLVPWDEVLAKYGAYHRIELEGDEVFLLEPYWGEVAAERAPQ